MAWERSDMHGNNSAVIQVLETLSGLTCTKVTGWAFPTGDIAIHFGELDAQGQGGSQLYCTCSWRFRAGRRIISSSAASGRDERGRCPSMMEASDQIVGRVLGSVFVDPTTLDVRLVFDDGVIMELFCDRMEAISDPAYQMDYLVSHGDVAMYAYQGRAEVCD